VQLPRTENIPPAKLMEQAERFIDYLKVRGNAFTSIDVYHALDYHNVTKRQSIDVKRCFKPGI
jgi:hypothetical protein